MAEKTYSRVVDVINFLAAHPTQSFTLTEISDRLSLSYATAYRILGALTQARYLVRHPKHKTYSLGMVLVAIGQSALARHQVIAIARRELLRLAGEFDVQCIANTVVDDDMLCLVKEGASRTAEGLAKVGERRPFMPPGGLAHVAWAKPQVVAEYLARAPETLSEDMRDYVVVAMETIRKRGYAVSALGPTMAELGRVIGEHPENYREDPQWTQMKELTGRLSRDEVQLLSLDDVGAMRLNQLSAPVFSPEGEVTLDLVITGIPHRLNAQEVEHYAQRLRAAAAVVTSETHGRIPRP